MADHNGIMASVVRRAYEIPRNPGRWGKFLVCLPFSAWGVSLWENPFVAGQWTAFAAAVHTFGNRPVAIWLLLISIGTVISLLSPFVVLRLITGALLSFTYGVLLFEVIVAAGFRASVGIFLTGVIATTNSNFRLVERLRRGIYNTNGH